MELEVILQQWTVSRRNGAGSNTAVAVTFCDVAFGVCVFVCGVCVCVWCVCVCGTSNINIVLVSD